jgi:hypothetical protein
VLATREAIDGSLVPHAAHRPPEQADRPSRYAVPPHLRQQVLDDEGAGVIALSGMPVALATVEAGDSDAEPFDLLVQP